MSAATTLSARHSVLKGSLLLTPPRDWDEVLRRIIPITKLASIV